MITFVFFQCILEKNQEFSKLLLYIHLIGLKYFSGTFYPPPIRWVTVSVADPGATCWPYIKTTTTYTQRGSRFDWCVGLSYLIQKWEKVHRSKRLSRLVLYNRHQGFPRLCVHNAQHSLSRYTKYNRCGYAENVANPQFPQLVL